MKREVLSLVRFSLIFVLLICLFVTPALADGTLPTTLIMNTPGWRVVTFWCSFCPCVKACERYSLIPLAKKYAGRVTFYAIDSDGYDLTMPPTQLQALIAHRHLPYMVLIDSDHSIDKYFKARVTPQTFILDPAGNIVFDGMPDDSRRFIYQPPHVVNGKMQVPNCYLAAALQEAVAGQAVTQSPLKEAGCSISW